MANELITSKGDDFLVDFSGEGKSKKSIAHRSKLTEYANTDLASGFPSNMIWTTLDGRRIAIPNLSDSHLLNILAYVRKRGKIYRKQMAIKMLLANLSTMTDMLFCDLSDDTKMDISNEMMGEVENIERLSIDAFLSTYIPIYSKLYQEAYKRKILIEVDKTKLK